MKNHVKNLSILIILFVGLNLLPNSLSAEIPPDNPGDDTDAPIDGGITFLLVAGVGYGVKKYRNNKKKV